MNDNDATEPSGEQNIPTTGSPTAHTPTHSEALLGRLRVALHHREVYLAIAVSVVLPIVWEPLSRLSRQLRGPDDQALQVWTGAEWGDPSKIDKRNPQSRRLRAVDGSGRLIWSAQTTHPIAGVSRLENTEGNAWIVTTTHGFPGPFDVWQYSLSGSGCLVHSVQPGVLDDGTFFCDDGWVLRDDRYLTLPGSEGRSHLQTYKCRDWAGAAVAYFKDAPKGTALTPEAVFRNTGTIYGTYLLRDTVVLMAASNSLSGDATIAVIGLDLAYLKGNARSTTVWSNSFADGTECTPPGVKFYYVCEPSGFEWQTERLPLVENEDAVRFWIKGGFEIRIDRTGALKYGIGTGAAARRPDFRRAFGN